MSTDRLQTERNALSAAAQLHTASPTDLGLLEALCKAAVAYTRARDALGAKPSPLPTGQRSANDPGYVIVPFGKNKGQYLDDVPPKDLRWLRGVVAESVEDPSKERYRGKNVELLDAIAAVLERRGEE